jgi:hypothetical protein
MCYYIYILVYISKDVLLKELRFQFFTLFPSSSPPASTSTSMSTAIPLLPTFGAYLPTELLLTASGMYFRLKKNLMVLSTNTRLY